MSSTTRIGRLVPSGNPVTRPDNKPDATAPVATKQDVGDVIHDALRGVDIGNGELTLIEALLAGSNGGQAVGHLAGLIHRARLAERFQVRAELTDQAALAEQVAEARAEERAKAEVGTTTALAALHRELTTAHAAEKQRLRDAWTVVQDTLTGR